VLTPIWLVSGVHIVGHGRALLLGVAVAVLSSALPYFLELLAISHVRASTYGVLLSIEPAIAAFMGFVILSQALTWMEMIGILAIIIAAAGASWYGSAGPRRRRRRRTATPAGVVSTSSPALEAVTEPRADAAAPAADVSAPSEDR